MEIEIPESLKLDLGGGETMSLGGVVCAECENHFWILVVPENAPSFCPYCGLEFQSFLDKK